MKNNTSQLMRRDKNFVPRQVRINASGTIQDVMIMGHQSHESDISAEKIARHLQSGIILDYKFP